ncbi:MAG: BlaI/MecI/CopY family transcriptional regulator [Gemmatimonadetes bacterium]|nr:BlaI/MecI/CopY family transcriptional regulator [Gemmatimonadota bacterium]
MEIRFTKRELDIMGTLWTHGPSTVGEVRDALEDDLAYNTVLTMLKVMERKGYVSRSRERRAHRYTAEVERDAAGRSALGRVTAQLFGGSPEELLLHLVDSGLDPDALRRMRDLLDQRLRDMEDDQ